MRQMSFEGGFQGRTNKLVDGCYSFWQGGAFPLIHMVLNEQGKHIYILYYKLLLDSFHSGNTICLWYHDESQNILIFKILYISLHVCI